MARSSHVPGATARGPFRADIGLGVVLIFVTFAAYGPALHGGLLVDDPDHITRPAWRSLAGLARIWFDVGITSQYFPVLHSTFWIEYRLWQDALVGYHVINVLQHAFSACLVVALMRRLSIPGAWLAGFVFALHPVCVESVAWISEQKNTLSTLFYLAAFYVYVGFDQDRRPARYWIATGLFVLALLTKSITATLGPALLVTFWWQRGRLEWRRDVRPLSAWMFLGIGFGLFTAWYERVYAHAQGASFDLGFLERCLIAGRNLVFYARTLVWPSNLMFINPRWAVEPHAAWQYFFPALAVVVALALAGVARRRRGPLAAFLLYVGSLFPILGFLNINWFSYSFVADHFQYLASLGLIVPTAAALTRMAQGGFAARFRLGPVISGGLVVLVLAVLTWQQSGTYRDAETLCRRTIEKNPSSWSLQEDLGVLLLSRPGQRAEAIDHLLAALALNPRRPRAYKHLGYAFSEIPGRRADAILAFESSLRLDPDDPEVLTLLGNALAQTPGRTDAALSAFRRVLQLDPNIWAAHVGLAQILSADPGQLAEAIAEYEAAIRLRPGVARLHFDLGGCLAGAGRTAAAITAFETTVRLEPENAAAHFNLGCLLADSPGRLADAVIHFETAARLTPDDPAVHNNFGLALLQLPGRRDDAIRQFQIELRLAPGLAEGHFNLGRALLLAPADEIEALRQFQAAVRLRPAWEAAQRAVAQLRARNP